MVTHPICNAIGLVIHICELSPLPVSLEEGGLRIIIFYYNVSVFNGYRVLSGSSYSDTKLF